MPTKPIPQLTAKDKERFLSKVAKRGPDECWLWMGHTNLTRGYGGFFLQGDQYRAHRVAFFVEYGYVDLNCLHTCDNPPCCNPKHLFLGTQLDNQRDRIEKGRAGYEGTGKLKEGQVLDIISRCKGGEPQQDLAEEYSVSISMVSRIVKGTRWNRLQLAIQ